MSGCNSKPSFLADSLKFTSAFAVAMAIVFLVITVGVTSFKLIKGNIAKPRLLPAITDTNSVWKLFTVVPVLVTSYVCHFNGKKSVFFAAKLLEYHS